MSIDHDRTTMMKKEKEAVIKLHQRLEDEMKAKKEELINSYLKQKEKSKVNTSF